MNEHTFGDVYLWKWMTEDKLINGHDTLSSILEETIPHQIDKSYVIEMYDPLPSLSDKEIIRDLRRLVPQHYWVQIEFCLSKYAEVFGMFFPPLAHYVEELAYIEWLLYVEPAYVKYRDHLVHMFKVASVATWFASNKSIMDKMIEFQFIESKHFDTWLTDKKCTKPDDDDKNKRKAKILRIAVLFAALFHDFGYGYFFQRLYKERLSRLYSWLEDEVHSNTPGHWRSTIFLDSLSASFLEEHHTWLSGNKDKTGEKRENILGGSAADLLGLNHSMASCLFILDILNKLIQARAINADLQIAFQLAAEAAMIHDMIDRKNYCHLSGKKPEEHYIDCELSTESPIAALLILSDELACWNRFKLRSSPSDNSKKIIYQIDYNEVPESIDIKITDSEIIIHPRSSKDRGDITKNLIKVLKEDLNCCHHSGEEWPFFLEYRVIIAGV